MQHGLKVIVLFFSALGLMGGPGAGAQAQGASTEPASAHSDGDWHFQVTPYVWGAGLDGKVAFAGRDPLPGFEVEASRSFSDTLNSLDFGGMAFFEARRNRFGLFAELFHIETTDSTSGSVTIPPESILITAGAKLKTSFTTALLAGQYRALDASDGHLDLLLGARYWSLENRVRISESVGSLAGGFTRQVSETWGSPVVGARGHYDFTSRAHITGWAMAGGIGISDYGSWDLMVALGYSLSDHFDLAFGYRYLSLEYEDSEIDFDADLHGPGIGLNIRF